MRLFDGSFVDSLFQKQVTEETGVIDEVVETPVTEEEPRRITRLTRRSGEVEQLDGQMDKKDIIAAIIGAEIIGNKVQGGTGAPVVEEPPPTGNFGFREREVIRRRDRSGGLQTGGRRALRAPRSRRQTKTLDSTNFPVKTRHVLVNTAIEGEIAGVLKEISIKSPSSAFSIIIILDGEKRLERTFTELQALSETSNLVDAFEDKDNLFVLHIGELFWNTEGFIELVANSGAIIFNNVFAHWEIDL